MKSATAWLIVIVALSAGAADERIAADPVRENIRLRAQVRQLREEINSLDKDLAQMRDRAEKAAMPIIRDGVGLTQQEWLATSGSEWKAARESKTVYSTTLRDAYGQHTYRISVKDGRIAEFFKDE
jgi:hypothetical protein